MNDKLDKLMYHAGLTAQGCWDEMDEYDRKAIEKFAELIVRECCEVAHSNFHVDGLTLGGIMKKHFGVEE
jgi:hypothetical protein